MKYKIGKREMCRNNVVINIGNGNLQNLLRGKSPEAYSTRIEGWACDYYRIPRNIVLCDGYDTCGRNIITSEEREFWDKKAERIWNNYDLSSETQHKLVDNLLADFAGTIEGRL